MTDILALLILAYCGLPLGWEQARGSDGFPSPGVQPVYLLVSLAVASLYLSLWRYHLLHRDVLLFDGRGWFTASGQAVVIDTVYMAPRLLAARIDTAGGRRRLLLLRSEVDRESWRRIRLALDASARSAKLISRESPVG